MPVSRASRNSRASVQNLALRRTGASRLGPKPFYSTKPPKTGPSASGGEGRLERILLGKIGEEPHGVRPDPASHRRTSSTLFCGGKTG